MTTRRDLVLQKLLACVELDQDSQLPEPFWQNQRNTGGLRLSQVAHAWLEKMQAPCWSFDLDPAWITPRNMLRMDRLIPVPYSLEISNRPRRCHVIIWDSSQAMTIELLGDFDRFLAALERTWQPGI